jgi:hypothetical protein
MDARWNALQPCPKFKLRALKKAPLMHVLRSGRRAMPKSPESVAQCLRNLDDTLVEQIRFVEWKSWADDSNQNRFLRGAQRVKELGGEIRVRVVVVAAQEEEHRDVESATSMQARARTVPGASRSMSDECRHRGA